MSIEFYDGNAQRYFAETVAADLSAPRARFLRHVPAGGKILDVGCGSGRDALVFARAGFDVTAFDGSVEMVKLAREHTGLPVRCINFEDVRWICAFDGLWACASLLHVKRRKLPSTLSILARTLRPHGAMYVSMKCGTDEREAEGRFFTDVSQDELIELLARSGMKRLEAWISPSVRPGREHELWVNVIAHRSSNIPRV